MNSFLNIKTTLLYTMFKKLCESIKKFDERRIDERLSDSNQRVSDLFSIFGVNIETMPIIVASQRDLKLIVDGGDKSSQNNGLRYGGLYSTLIDRILIDRETSRWGRQETLDRILSHEYAHRIFKKIWSLWEKYEIIKLNRLRLGNSQEGQTPLDALKKFLESSEIESLTEYETRRLEFNNYFEEMFAESVAIYLTDPKNIKERWFNYSRLNQGFILSQDKEFTKQLEETLYYAFQTKLSEQGLVKVSMTMPFLYTFLSQKFKERYTRLISS